MNFFTRSQRLGPAAVILALSVFVSRFMGLIRDKAVAYYFGAGLESDLYNAAFVIPDFINYLLAGAYFSITLIPMLTRLLQEDEENAWDFFSAALLWISLAAFFSTALAWIFAPALARLSAPGLSNPEAYARLTLFLRIILPAQVCVLSGACFTALLTIRRQFALPALTPLIYNGCIIILGIGAAKIFPERGMEGFCWGVLAGAALGALILPCLAARAGGLRLRLKLFHPGLRRFMLLALPLMLGQSIVALDEQLLRFFGSFGAEGAISQLSYARRIFMAPVAIAAQSIGAASYPFLATLAATGDRDGFDRTLNRALLSSLSALLPLSLWMISAATPIIRLIFQQGSLNAQAALSMSSLLSIMLGGAFCWAVHQLLSRGFYARQNTLTPVLTGSLTTLAALPLYLFLSEYWGARGVALASVSSIALYTLLLGLRWRAHFGTAALRGLGQRLLTLLLLSAPGVLLARLSCDALDKLLPASPYLAALLALCAAGAIFTLSFALLCRLLTPTLWREGLARLASLIALHS